jgi:predicted ABC-type ATPase
MKKRLRIFAGPNGSGKSTILQLLPSTVDLGYYINADDIERCITQGHGISLKKYGVKANTEILYDFFEQSSFVKEKSDLDKLKSIFFVERNYLKIKSMADITPKYSAAIISEFLREFNLKNENDFSFETVMSHKDKVTFIKKAAAQGYKVYLYYVCLDNYKLNIDRVATRVAEGGHHVSADKIKARYSRSLGLLLNALKASYKSYLFDNSKENPRLIVRVNRDKKIHLQVSEQELPNWYIKNVVNKLKKV